MQTVSITPRFQIHIPVAIRKKIGLNKPMQARIEAKKGQIVITPQKDDFLMSAGSLHKYWKKNPVPVENIRDYIDYGDL